MAAPLDDVLSDAGVAAALEHVARTDDRTVADQVAICEVPAPPFREGERARWFARRLAELGLRPELDGEGNVIAPLPARIAEAAPVLAVSHLDTVFPEGTDVAVTRGGGRLWAPGISDNCRGLAALLAIARAWAAADLRPERPVLLIGSVGEEGAGDLRGVKHLFRAGGIGRKAAAFVAVDGGGVRRIVHRAVGSRRLRVEVRGPGGHSWADWGRANPAHAVGAAVASLHRLRLPREPRTTLSVGRIGGGTGINVIPELAWLEVDLRCEAEDVLGGLERRARRAVYRAVSSANDRREPGTPPLRASIERFGNRPAGATPADDPLVRAALQATRRLGEEPELIASSTDANIAMSLGVPAVAVGAGGDSGCAHTEDEWYENTGGAAGIQRALLLLLAAAG